jgi:SHAQKYF class myb-like DNA-binding protein
MYGSPFFDIAITQYGKDWKKVEAYVRTRSGSQVRSHAQKFFNKLQKVNQHH